jgi:spore coat protein H
MPALFQAATLLVALAALGIIPDQPLAAQDRKPEKGKGADLFADPKVLSIHITIAAKEFEAMQPPMPARFGFPPPAQNEPKKQKNADGRDVHRNAFGVDLPWAVGTFEALGERFEDVAIRYKGNGTIMDAARTIKKSIKFDLDRRDPTKRFRGLKTLNLHSGVADPSKARETLGYSAYRAAGVPAPRTRLAEVTLTVPGKYDKEYLGLFTVVEPIDKAFLKSHYKTDKGLLMKPERVGGLNFLGDNWEAYKGTYQPKRDAKPAEQQRVIDFTRLVNAGNDEQFRKEIGSFIDMDAFLRFMAVTALEVNMDSFFTLGHNYCLYLHPATNKFHFIPWDLDRTFANFPIFGSSEQLMDLSITKPHPQNRLADRLMAIKEVRSRYEEIVKEIAASAFTKKRLMDELDSFEAATKDILDRERKAAAARRENGQPGFGPPGMFGRVPDVKPFVEKRTESVAAQLAGKSKGYEPQNFGFGPPGGFGPGNQLARPLLGALDADRDGQISEAEFANGMKRLFSQWDVNKDGRLDQKELADGLQKLMPAPKGPFGGPPGGMPPFGGPPGRPGNGPPPRPKMP